MPVRFFYGYVILALCFVNMVFLRGVIGSFSVFYLALIEEFEWSYGTAASIASVNAIVYAFPLHSSVGRLIASAHGFLCQLAVDSSV